MIVHEDLGVGKKIIKRELGELMIKIIVSLVKQKLAFCPINKINTNKLYINLSNNSPESGHVFIH